MPDQRHDQRVAQRAAGAAPQEQAVPAAAKHAGHRHLGQQRCAGDRHGDHQDAQRCRLHGAHGGRLHEPVPRHQLHDQPGHAQRRTGQDHGQGPRQPADPEDVPGGLVAGQQRRQGDIADPHEHAGTGQNNDGGARPGELRTGSPGARTQGRGCDRSAGWSGNRGGGHKSDHRAGRRQGAGGLTGPIRQGCDGARSLRPCCSGRSPPGTRTRNPDR